MKKLICLLLVAFTFSVAQTQIFTKPSNPYGTIANRYSIDSALYFTTDCGIPHDTASLYSVGFGNGQKMKKAAIYYDSCGHHLYVYDPAVKDWHRVDSGSGGSGGSGLDTIYRKRGVDSIYFTIGGGAEQSIKDSSGGGGSTPGLSQVLAVSGSIGTVTRTIKGNGTNDLLYDSLQRYEIRYTTRTKIYADGGQAALFMLPTKVQINGGDSVYINLTGKFSVTAPTSFYGSLTLTGLGTARTDTTANKPMAIDVSNGSVGYLDHWPTGTSGGGGLPPLTQDRLFVGGTGNVPTATNTGFTYDSTHRAAHVDTMNAFKANINTDSAPQGRFFAMMDSYGAYGLIDTSWGYAFMAASFTHLIPKIDWVSSSTLEKGTPLNPFGAANFVDRVGALFAGVTVNKNDRFYINGIFNDMRYNGGTYNRGNWAIDAKRVLDTFIAHGGTYPQITIGGPYYVTPTSYTSLGGNPAITQAIHLTWIATADSLAAALGTHFYDTYNYTLPRGGATNIAADSVHFNYIGHQLGATGLIGHINASIGNNSNAANVQGTLRASKIEMDVLDTAYSTPSGNGFVIPLGVNQQQKIVGIYDKVAMLNYGSAPNHGSLFMDGFANFQNGFRTNNYSRLGYTEFNGALPASPTHDIHLEIGTISGGNKLFFGFCDRTSGYTGLPIVLGLQSDIMIGALTVPGSNSERLQVDGKIYSNDYIKTDAEIIASGAGHIGSGSIASDFGVGGNSGAIDVYAGNSYFTGNGAFLAIAGNSTKASFLSFVEKSIAARWSIGTKGGDHLFYFTYGSSDGTLGRVKFTVDSLNGKIVWPNRPVLSVADSNAAVSKWYVDSVAAALGSGQPFSDASALVKNSSDATKLVKLSATSITTGTTRTWTFPDVSGTFARIDAAQTFTGIQDFTSSPTMPTPSPGDNSSKGAPTAFVTAAIAALPIIASGTFTPTSTNGANVASSTPALLHWTRVGNEISVEGLIYVTATLTATSTVVDIDLPILSAFFTTDDLTGGASSSSVLGLSGGCIANTITNTATLTYVSPGTGSYAISYHYKYTYVAP